MVGSHDVPGAATNASLSLFLQVVSFFVGMIAAGFDSWIFPMILKSEFLPPIVMIRAMASLKTILGWSQTVLIVFSVLSFVLFLRDVSNYIGYQEGSQKASALRTRVINLLTISVVIVVLSLLMLMALVYPGLLGFLAFFGLAVPVLIVGVAILGLFAFFSYARLILNVAAKVRSFSLLEASAAAPDELGPKATIAKL
jgi:hypothetical protein